jgi:predicted nuclease with RNAse H fold
MKAYVGIDVQETPGCCFAVIGEDTLVLESGWLGDPKKDAFLLIKKLMNKNYEVLVGIDAPRTPLKFPRQWYWDGSHTRWRSRRQEEKGYGRHCEIVVRVHDIANPQYTPLAEEAPAWMKTGFKLFLALQDIVQTYEVFPTASYTLLEGITDVQIGIDFSSCKLGPKDILDAFVAATTVREVVHERGCRVGGGDGLGEIILPRSLRQPVIKEVLTWPKD